MERTQRRTWAEIDLHALEHNYRALREGLPWGCKFVGVVKADAYGHGAIPVAKALEGMGADYLAVACLEEAEELREGGICMPILILGVTPPECTGELLKYGLTQTVACWEDGLAYARAAEGEGSILTVHIKMDTGMGRLGFDWEEAEGRVRELMDLPGLEVEGLFTHFAAADGDEEFTMEQFTRFLTVTDGLAQAGLRPRICHCAASGAVLHYPCTHMDMVRPGIALYGHMPGDEMEGLCDLRPVMTLKTRVAALRELPEGATVSYGRTHTLRRPSRVAVLPVGYGDGFSRLLSNRATVLVGGVKCPVLGRVCMDMTMVDVTGLPDVAVGDEVTLFGPDLPLEDQARQVGTIGYELLCAVSKRVKRVYR